MKPAHWNTNEEKEKEKWDRNVTIGDPQVLLVCAFIKLEKEYNIFAVLIVHCF